MSPSEHDLRAALRDGEGDGVDAGRVIDDADAQRRQRRVRLLSAAAAAVVVAAGATGLALWRGGTQQPAAGPARTLAPISRAPLPTTAAASSGGFLGPGMSCPPALPAVHPPTAYNAKAVAGSLFAKPVSKLVICAYPGVDDPETTAPDPYLLTVLSGARAQSLVASLDSGPKIPPEGLRCPAYISANARMLAVYGVTADGTVLPPVIAMTGVPACQRPVTNGVAVRYGWTPPPPLALILAKLPPIAR